MVKAGVVALVIVLVVLVGVVGFFGFVQQAALPDDLVFERTAFPLIKDYTLPGSVGVVDLGEGTSLGDVFEAKVVVRGCGGVERLTVNGENYEVKLRSCEDLFFKESGDDIAFQHFAEASVVLVPSSLDRKISYAFSGAERVVSRKLVISELVECTRDAQCVASAPVCSVVSHRCLARGVVEDLDAGDSFVAREGVFFFSPTVLVGGLVALLFVVALILAVKRRRQS